MEPGTGFWWEASYADPTAGSGNPIQAMLTIHYRSEMAWTGTFTVAMYKGSTVLARVNLPVDSRAAPTNKSLWLAREPGRSNDMALRYAPSDRATILPSLQQPMAPACFFISSSPVPHVSSR